MKVKELKGRLENLDDEAEIVFYVWDYEYDSEEPYEVGRGKFTGFDGRYINIGINK